MGTKNKPGAFDCYKAAGPDEPMFVLLARDPLAPDLVRQWADRRATARGNDEKVAEARQCADAMTAWQQGRTVSGPIGKPMREGDQ